MITSASNKPTPPADKTAFAHGTARLVIGSLDDPKLTISAQYNPREIQITQAGGWTDHKKKDGSTAALHVEYTCGQPRTLQVELLFDGYESDGVIGNRATMTVKQAIATLQSMISLREVRRSHEDWRPHFCVVAWGTDGMPSMRCVIDSLQTKYQVFSATGKVLRATCTLSLKEARRVDLDMAAPHNKNADKVDAEILARRRTL